MRNPADLDDEDLLIQPAADEGFYRRVSLPM
jgi:hypothetical protein